jgi:hypothetical protein
MSANQLITPDLDTIAGQVARIQCLGISLGLVNVLAPNMRAAVLASMPPRFRQCLQAKLTA